MRRFARPYTEALFSVAGSVEAAETVRRELAAFQEMMAGEPALARMAANTAVPIEAKQRVLAAIAEEAGFGGLTLRLLGALAARYRLERLPEILEGVEEEANRRRGVSVAAVTSARPLSTDEEARLRAALERKLGGAVKIETEIDESLLGGFVVQVGSQLWDASLRGQLDRLTEELATA